MIVDEEKLRSHFEGDEEMIADLIDIYVESYPDIMERLKRGIAEKDFKEIELQAHTIKGVLLNFFAVELVEVAAKIEVLGHKESDADISTLYEVLELKISKVANEVKKIFGVDSSE
ncbi:MAG: Hpt domain-containing protein [Halobacteriovoraceae bacterium]|jgi:HPt (histidine-containing phosphotransfer) domain-containing protein|nr:Hpt domain-containing protein [Halobacteriovoraceae bacterium]